MIRLHVMTDFTKPGIKAELPGKDGALEAAKLFTKDAKGIFARVDTDDELVALDLAVNARNAKAMERAAAVMVGQVSVIIWKPKGQYVDGPGWRIVYAPTELEGVPAQRAPQVGAH